MLIIEKILRKKNWGWLEICTKSYILKP